jgi:16S rRNA (guanine527-N7)-methyltransferase
MFNKFIDQIQNDFNVKISDVQQKQFKTYFETLISYNEKVNLTRITEESEVYYKHFYDSLTILKTMDINHVISVCDMGAGAGFPSLPIKILYPHLKVTIVDSLGKRITFLKNLLEALCINDVELIYDRVETYALKHQNEFDIVTARALGSLQLIIELGIPMLKVGKYFVAYKGSNYQKEINESINGLKLLRSYVDKTYQMELPNDMGFRSLVLIKKEKHIDGYPRSFAIMKKKPL